MRVFVVVHCQCVAVLLNYSHNYDDECCETICFQGARHTFAQMAGRNVANPVAMLLCACDMLEHLQ